MSEPTRTIQWASGPDAGRPPSFRAASVMDYLVDSLTLGDWLVLFLLILAAGWAVCATLVLVALLPRGVVAGRRVARLVLPHRPGVASWCQLHPAWQPPAARLLVGRPRPASGATDPVAATPTAAAHAARAAHAVPAAHAAHAAPARRPLHLQRFDRSPRATRP